MDSIINAMKNLVSISAFNKGDAGKIFNDVKKTNEPKLVLKRNEPECILLSPQSYIDLMDELEDLRDYKLVVERLSSPNEIVSWDNAMKELGMDGPDFMVAEDVEFE